MMRRLRGALIRVVRYVPSHLPRHRGAARNAAPRPSKVGGFSRRRRLTRRPGWAGTGGANGCPRWRAQSPPGWLPARLLPRQRRGGRGNASPLHSWGSMLAVGSVGQGVVGDPPCCRGQAVPDPPARRAGNPVVRRWAWWWVGRRGGRCMPRRMPRQRRGGRGSASPLQGMGGMSAVVSAPAAGGCCIPPAGRGQAVPDPPARRAGNPVVRRWAWWWVGRRGGRCMPRRMPRLEARRARQRLAPTGDGRQVRGGICTCCGWVVHSPVR
jgi:hypothetical protein